MKKILIAVLISLIAVTALSGVSAAQQDVSFTPAENLTTTAPFETTAPVNGTAPTSPDIEDVIDELGNTEGFKSFAEIFRQINDWIYDAYCKFEQWILDIIAYFDGE